MTGRPELLSPAGSPEALRAAVQCGADAVYLGVGSFNARRGAKNFSEEDFLQALSYCHLLGVKVYLTLNTLLTDRELPQALQTARMASQAGVDAVLVQDWGLFELLRQTLPDLPLHASTQMSIFTSGGALEASRMGCTRVVVARELSGEDIARIIRASGAEIEVFAHGALCMSYSGQCSMSAFLGGRSGNRGTCAQPCRLPYRLERDGRTAKPGHPLSLKDSSMADHLEELRKMGVACLKLEGRMKRPEYVAVVTSIYARLLRERRTPTAEEAQQLSDAFSRSGFTDWYYHGKRGAGMFGTRPEGAQEPRELFAQIRSSYESGTLRTVGVSFFCRVGVGVPVVLTATDDRDHIVSVTGPVPEAARSRAVTASEVEERLKKTGGTAFHCTGATAVVDEGLSLSAASINALRRQALEELTTERVRPPKRRSLEPQPLPPALGSCEGPPRLTCSLSRGSQISEELVDQGPARIYLPLERIGEFDLAPYLGRTEFYALFPRVWRDTDESELRSLLLTARDSGVTGLGLSNLGHFPLARESGMTLAGDFGLNVFNSRSLLFLHQRGLSSAAVSFELRREQIRDLQKFLSVEAAVYGRLPLQITENCLVQNDGGCPCDGTAVLRDRTNASFPILPAYGCRSELQNSRVLWLADREDWKDIGLSYARLRFTTESAEECAQVFRAYRRTGEPPALFTRGLFYKGVD